MLDCHLVTDPRSRESRGFAFVTMETVEDAERCIKYLNRSVLEGRLVTVEKVSVSVKGVTWCSVPLNYFIMKNFFLQKCCLISFGSRSGVCTSSNSQSKL